MEAMRRIRSTPAGANASYVSLRCQAYEDHVLRRCEVVQRGAQVGQGAGTFGDKGLALSCS